MKALETRWKGYRFRSRTEARWAVFLDALSLTFDYEPEGLALPSGPYLPDFRIRSLGMWMPNDINGGFKISNWYFEERPFWLEVKGATPSETEMLRCVELAIHSGECVLLAIGPPNDEPQIYHFDPTMESKEPEYLLQKARERGLLMFGQMSNRDGYCLFNEEARQVLNELIEHADRVSPPGTPEEIEALLTPVMTSTNVPLALSEVLSQPIGVLMFMLMAAEDEDAAEKIDRLKAVSLGSKPGIFTPLRRWAPQIGPPVRHAYDQARSVRFEFGETPQRWSQ